MGRHTCHALGCSTPVSPTLLMCRRHWAMVPTTLRLAVVKNYRRGQCEDRRVSAAWLRAARAAINYVASQENEGE